MKTLIKALILDVDGVVLKMRDEHGKFIWEYTIAQDLGLSGKHIAQIFSTRWKHDVLRGKYETMRYLEEVFNDPAFKGLAISPEAFMHYWVTKDSNLNHDVLHAVNNLSIPVYLGTNQEAYRTKYLVELLGKQFKGCFASYHIGTTKPEPFFYRHIEQSLGLNPEELLLIDDSVAHVEAAKKCGWHGYHYQDDVTDLQEFIRNNISH